MIELQRFIDVGIILVAALAATAARMIQGIIKTGDYPPEDSRLRRLWNQRMRWALAGEISAVVFFVLVAEAMVMMRNWSGPTGVIIGALAAVLGFPFIAGMIRRRVTRKFEGDGR